jgi:hypothetical protein
MNVNTDTIVITYIHQPEETRGIDGDLEEGVYLTMVDGISDIMEDMEVSIICQQLYRAYVHTILIGKKNFVGDDPICFHIN